MPHTDSKHLQAWRASAREEGYLKKGAAFKPLPKKGTKAYRKIKARYNKK